MQGQALLRLTAAFAAGACLNLAFAPFGWWPIAMLVPAGLYALIRGLPPRRAGWTGAAFGAKLAAPDKHVMAVTGDGFYMFGTANAALWAGKHYGAAFTIVVFQNRAYSTGTTQIKMLYGPDSFAGKTGFEGGTFDPPMDFAKEAEACGAHGENVRDPAEITPALRRAKEANQRGIPAVVSVWVEPLV